MTQTLGLKLDPNHVYHVPGNHDHWKGQSKVSLLNRPPAYNAGAFPDLLEPTPWRQPLWSPNRKFAFELFGIDSNEGLNHKGTNFYAKGKLSKKELDGLRNHLTDAQNDAVKDKLPRVVGVACHHSFGTAHGISGARALVPKSLSDLLKEVRQKKNPFQ